MDGNRLQVRLVKTFGGLVFDEVLGATAGMPQSAPATFLVSGAGP